MRVRRRAGHAIQLTAGETPLGERQVPTNMPGLPLLVVSLLGSVLLIAAEYFRQKE